MTRRIFFSSIALALIPFSASAASISPAMIDLKAGRGETISSEFTVINTGAAEQKYFLDTVSFTSKDETGTPKFFENGNGNDLAKWIQFPSAEISVPARSKAVVPFQVIVPSDVTAGNHEAAITVSRAPSDIVATNGAIIEAKTALLVFLTIKGETIKQVSLLDFIDSLSNQWRSELSGNFSYRIQNQGNVYAVPNGTIELKDLFGRVLLKADANPTGGRILPNSTRKFEVGIGNAQKGLFQRIKTQIRTFSIGPITSELSLQLGEGFKPIRAQATFWYIPYETIGIIFLGFVVMILIYRMLSKKTR